MCSLDCQPFFRVCSTIQRLTAPQENEAVTPDVKGNFNTAIVVLNGRCRAVVFCGAQM